MDFFESLYQIKGNWIVKTTKDKRTKIKKADKNNKGLCIEI